MPLLAGNFPGNRGEETQPRLMARLSGEDSKAGGEVVLQGFPIHQFAVGLEDVGTDNARHREGAQAIAQVAEGV